MSLTAHDTQGNRGRRIQSIFFGCLKVAPSLDEAEAQGVSDSCLTRLACATALLGDLSSSRIRCCIKIDGRAHASRMILRQGCSGLQDLSAGQGTAGWRHLKDLDLNCGRGLS